MGVFGANLTLQNRYCTSEYPPSPLLSVSINLTGLERMQIDRAYLRWLGCLISSNLRFIVGRGPPISYPLTASLMQVEEDTQHSV